MAIPLHHCLSNNGRSSATALHALKMTLTTDMPDPRSAAVGSSHIEERRVASSLNDANSCSYAVVADGPGAGAYSEEAFRYLLAIERKRGERSGRPFFLLLVDLKRHDGDVGMDVDVATQVFSGLARALRDTDFIGWYREGRIVGAVLTQLTDFADSQIPRIVGQRIKNELFVHLPSGMADRLQTRVFQLPRSVRS